ncbi:non-ribosomal peptide synthetase [Streptomyces sp. NPDC059999]|uniref:non-ribosomal peptide synthetase n=1 Tax=unclassified Streptomyces TaxID=2593676 RepID=UPI002E37FC35|nr:non-ribosomal peptide synthetase [Streptomyces sp. NBC_01426]
MATLLEPADDRLDTLLLRRWDGAPERVAVVDGDREITAGELRDRCLRVASLLRRRGARPGDRVAVYVERSAEFVVGVSGVVLAGAAQVAFDANDPVERTLDMLADCRPRLLITTAALRSRLPAGLDVEVVTVEECATAAPVGAFEPAADLAEQPAVAIYTSGSTGRPKASLIPHRAVASRLKALQRAHGLGEDDRMLHHTACSFDMFLIEVYWPLITGATIVIAAPGRQRDADYLARMIREADITTFYCVVSLLDLFLSARGPEERFDGLRRVLTGGEPLGPELVRRFHARSTAPLTNLYGPSECTIYCTAWVPPRDPEPDTVYIGSAIEDTTLRILDEEGRPVADGEPGELYIGGAGLALGYLDRPELTAERFVPDHLGDPGDLLYRSGDLVRSHPVGGLEFLGRVDLQVKVRGYRIELGEIEAVALRVPGVRQAAAVACGSGGEARLVGFLVAGPGTDPEAIAAAVREALRSALPGYMVPAALTVLSELPLTANGKLDRALLADRALTALPATTARETPAAEAGEVEKLVADVWCEVLGLPAIGLHDDFFDIGGDSFKVIRVTRKLEKLLGFEVPMHLVFDEPTVAGFGAALAERQEEEQ